MGDPGHDGLERQAFRRKCARCNRSLTAFGLSAEGLSQLQIGEVLGVDHKTRFLFCLSRNPHVEKARAEFERAQKVEERFHSEFDGLDFTSR